MKISILFGLILVFSFTATAGDIVRGGPHEVVDEYIVVLKENAGKTPAEVARAHGLNRGHTYQHVFKGFSATIPEARLNRLAQDPDVLRIEADKIARTFDDGDVGANAGRPPGDSTAIIPQSIPWGVTRVGGPVNIFGSPLFGKAFVIDTGIDPTHADLKLNTTLSKSFVLKGKITYADGNGHGTHVAGTIGAIDNTRDVVGVAAGAELVAVRVLDNAGSGQYSWVIAGIDYVRSVGVPGDVANMSLGGPASASLDAAVTAAADAGIKFSLAAGNESTSANNSSPARVNHANVYTVSAINNLDVFASFSNYGNPPVDYAAPGVAIVSTKKGGGTTSLSGTSMAAPHVAGLLLLRGNAGLTSAGSAQQDPDGNPDPIAHY